MTDRQLSGKVALVTGGADGIGRASALALAGEGAALVILDRNAEVLERTGAEMTAAGIRVWTHHVDVMDVEALRSAMQQALEVFGGLDVLVNNAGFRIPNDTVLDADLETWNQMFAVHVRAPVLLISMLAKHLIARGAGGKIVNVSSSGAFRAVSSPAAYSSSKLALFHVTRVAAKELGQYDINVNAVVPGFTAVPRNADGGTEFVREEAVRSGPLANFFGRLSMPEDVAAVVRFLCLPDSRQITGQAIHTSAGLIV